MGGLGGGGGGGAGDGSEGMEGGRAFCALFSRIVLCAELSEVFSGTFSKDAECSPT